MKYNCFAKENDWSDQGDFVLLRIISSNLLLPFLLLYSFNVGAFIISSGAEKLDKKFDLNKSVLLLEDQTNQLSFGEVKEREQDFLSGTDKPFHIGYTESTYWIKLELTNNSLLEDWVILVENPMLVKSFYYSKGIKKSFGSDIPINEKPIKEYVENLIPLKIVKGEKVSLYLQINSPNQIDSNFYLLRADFAREKIRGFEVFSWLINGIIFGLFLYNLLLFFSTKDKNFLYYCFFVVSSFFISTLLNGRLDRLIPLDGVDWAYQCFILGSIAIFAANWFSFNFLNIKKILPKYSLYCELSLLIGLGIIVISFFYRNPSFGYIVDGYLILTFILYVSLGIKLIQEGSRPARFFLISWGGLGLSALFFLAGTHKLISDSSFTYYALNIGIAFEMLTISMGLGDKINLLQKKLITTLKELNLDLEKRVEERTAMILEQQKKLIHSEKMATVGEMASGAAHEINNPLMIIMGNAKIVEKVLMSAKDNEDIKEKILNKIKKINASSERIAKIVSGLLTFSRKESSELHFEKVSLQSILDDVHKEYAEKLYKAGIDFKVETEKNLDLECLPTQILEVLSSFVNNSYDAIKEKIPSWIHIRGFDRGDFIEIQIRDSGEGIPIEIQDKLFSPFFSTKDIGEGTGLGLSISYGIIRGHQGSIHLNEKGDHTEFLINIPKAQIELY